jgi:thioredoxin reductase (NADPH)
MYDIVIIGTGCAGYTAAIYCARYNLRTLIIGTIAGGIGITAADVGDWPGTKEIKGLELMENMKKHALSFEGTEHRNATVTKIEKKGEGKFTISLEDGSTVQARAVIICTGSEKRKLDVKGEDTYAGKGLTYCATCDAYFFKGKTVAVIGGGDSALEGVGICAQVSRHVYLIHRRSEFKAQPFWIERARKRRNVTFVLERQVVEVLGDGEKVTGVRLDKLWDGGQGGKVSQGGKSGSDVIAVDGVFIEIGSDPASRLAKAAGCALDEKGFINVNAAQATSIQGIFAAGDVSSGSNYFAQFTTAAGEGSVAANAAFQYLSRLGS